MSMPDLKNSKRQCIGSDTHYVKPIRIGTSQANGFLPLLP